MRNYMDRSIAFMRAERLRKEKELAFQERQKKYKEKEKSSEN